ncbi:MAG: hypothetical protein QOD76_902 [Solirubrobacteraceae bacterium]|jgi:hypothetical protein|nr:hypothetical protein [Solirubrobacteraceae bacterium]
MAAPERRFGIFMATVADTETGPNGDQRQLRFSVLVPLFAMRGDVVEHLRTWADEQTLDRDCFQLVVASDGSDPALERRVAAMLGPHDLLERAPGSHSVELYNAAAARAAAPWVVLTEAHCSADRACLASLAEAIDREAGLDAARLVVGGHIRSTPFGDTLARWFDQVFADWTEPGQWPRLSFFGAAIRRDVYLAAGAVDARYGLFSPMLLSARLVERGARVARIPDSQVFHVADDDIREALEHTADFANGECTARTDHEAEFCERYFGHAGLWANRLRYRREIARHVAAVLAHAALRAAVKQRAETGWLVRELAAWAPACAAGADPYLLWERARLRWSELAADRFAPGQSRRSSGFEEAHRRVVRVTQLRWIRDHDGPPPPPMRATGRWPVAELPGAALVGIHGLEVHRERNFRWTEPVALLRLPPVAGEQALIVDTGGLRGPPLDYVDAVYAGTSRVPRDSLRDDGQRLIVRLPPLRAAAPYAGTTILSRPLEPRQVGRADLRRLGMPVFSVELGPWE